MCVGFRCRARIIIPLFFLFPDGRGLNKGKSFLVAAFVVHADFIQVHAFVFFLLGDLRSALVGFDAQSGGHVYGDI